MIGFSGAGASPQATPAGGFGLPFVTVASDPSVTPGRTAEIGVRAFLGDGTAAWDKTGPADTDWTPVGSGAPPTPPVTPIVTRTLVADFDPSSGITLNGGNVASWAEKIANYTVAQATGGLQPAFVANAYAGNPGVRFNGTATATLKNTVANLIAGGARTVMAMVLPGADNANGGTVFCFRTSAEGVAGLIGLGGLKRVSLFSQNRNAPEMDTTLPVCVEWLFDAGLNLTVNQYGVRQPLTTAVQDPESGATGFQIGNLETWTDAPANLTVLRLLAYGSDLTDAELAQNRTAFAAQYTPSSIAGRVLPADYWDSANTYPITLGGSTTTAPSSQAVLRLSVPHGVASVPIGLSTNLIAQGIDPSVAVFVDGTLTTHWTPTADNDVETFTLALDGNAHIVEIWGSYQTSPLSNAVPCGTYIQSIPNNVSIVRPSTVARRLGVYGASIESGFAATIIPTDSWVSLVRQNGTRGRVALEAWGGRTLSGDCNVGTATPISFLDLTTTAKRLVQLVAGATRKQLWIAMCINDWLHDLPTATFTATLGTLLDTVHSLDATISDIILQGATLTAIEASTNANGDHLDDMRAAMAAAAVGRPYSRYLNYKNVIVLGDLVGNLHPNNVGHAKIAAQAIIDLGA